MSDRRQILFRRSFVVPALLTPVFGVLGWLSATGLNFATVGHIALALGAMAFALGRLLQPVVVKLWRRATGKIEHISATPDQPQSRAWIVWVLGVLVFVDLVCIFGFSHLRDVFLPAGLLLAGALLGYLGLRTRGGKRLQWALVPLAGWLCALSGEAMPFSPDQTVLLTNLDTKLAGFDKKLDLALDKLDTLFIGQEKIHAGQDKTHSGQDKTHEGIEKLLVGVAALAAERDPENQEGFVDTAKGDPPPKQAPWTDEERAAAERLKTMAEALAEAGNEEALLALYQIALETNDTEKIEELEPEFARLHAKDTTQYFDIWKSRGTQEYYDERYPDAAESFLQALRRRPDNEYVRSGFGSSVVNALYHAEEPSDRLDALLDELAGLVVVHADDPDIREELAMGLTNTIGDSESDFARADGLLGELRELVETHPEDAAVRELLASGLNNAIFHSGSDFDRADGLLDELRELATNNPEDGKVREPLAWGLYNALYDSRTDLARADQLLDELRQLVGQHSESSLTQTLSQREREQDEAVREQFAHGLFVTFARLKPDAPRGLALLDELGQLAADFSEDAAVRGWHAKALRRAIERGAGTPDHRRVLVERFQALAEEHDHVEMVRREYALWLQETLKTRPVGSPAAERLLDELRGLAADYPKDGTVHEQFVMTLNQSIHRYGDDSDRADGLLAELGALAGRLPEDEDIRRGLARHYAISVHLAIRHGNTAQAAEIAKALVPLRRTAFLDPAVITLIEENVTAALELAVEHGDAEAERRLRAAREALFGG